MLYSKLIPRTLFAIGVCLPLAVGISNVYALDPQKQKSHEGGGTHLLVDVVFGMQTAETAHPQASMAAAPESAGFPQPGMAIRATQSLMVAGIYSINDSTHVGARAAVTLGSSWPAAATFNGNLAALSNTEIEAERLLRLSPDTQASFGMSVVLPSAPGHEPEDDTAPGGTHTSIAALTNLGGELSEAAAASRGFEDSALFRAERIGIIPKVHIIHHSNRLHIESMVKLENLLSMRGAPHHPYLGELVVGGFYGYDVMQQVTLGVRLWSNVVIEDIEQNMLVCEPQLQIHTLHIHGALGAVMPIVQRRDSPTGLTGLRIAAAAAF